MMRANLVAPPADHSMCGYVRVCVCTMSSGTKPLSLLDRLQ